MIRLHLTGPSRDALVQAITELREGLDRHVDFGLPLEDEYGQWHCHGYQLTRAEFAEAQRSGDWPNIDWYGKIQ
ncbi:hypothetical protein [Herpetosiphon geysericola]|uniref:Uncharacterized protein n=1 Tax=Herpetosiphon geysericola TaxID=70996 RepID=A0A0P6YDC4_9CHLR|nr:hypothetical protein [Herpetosiphon geysericola]KPL90000.1 hypothetical protein SE18_08590 [Herpetosiphon geysericola]